MNVCGFGFGEMQFCVTYCVILQPIAFQIHVAGKMLFVTDELDNTGDVKRVHIEVTDGPVDDQEEQEEEGKWLELAKVGESD